MAKQQPTPRHELRRQAREEAALRICEYLLKNRPDFLHTKCELDPDDLSLLSTYFGLSTAEYEH